MQVLFLAILLFQQQIKLIDHVMHEVVEQYDATFNNDDDVVKQDSLPKQIFAGCNHCNGTLHGRN